MQAEEISASPKKQNSPAAIERIKLRSTYINNIGVAFFGAGAIKLIFDIGSTGVSFGGIFVLIIFIIISAICHLMAWKNLEWMDKGEEPKELAWPFYSEKIVNLVRGWLP